MMEGGKDKEREGERERDRRVESSDQRFCRVRGSFVRI